MYFVGYEFPRTLEPTDKVIQVYPNGTYGKLRISKDVIFHDAIDFTNEDGYPNNSDFNMNIDQHESGVPDVPAPMIPMVPSQ